MRLSKITWPTAERYFKENDMVILPIGSTECHGRHMPLGTDTLIPDKILDLIEEKNDNILIAPMIPYGACQSLADYPGTINIDSDVLYQYVYQIVDGLYKHGARCSTDTEGISRPSSASAWNLTRRAPWS